MEADAEIKRASTLMMGVIESVLNSPESDSDDAEMHIRAMAKNIVANVTRNSESDDRQLCGAGLVHAASRRSSVPEACCSAFHQCECVHVCGVCTSASVFV